MKQRPLIPVALFYTSGILLAAFPVPLLPLFVTSFVLGLLCLVCTETNRVLLPAFLIFAGWTNAAQRSVIISPCDLRSEFPRPDESVTIRGVLSETPYHRVHEIRNTQIWSSMARIEVNSVRTVEGSWQPACGEVMSSTREFLTDKFFAGQTVEVSGVLHRAKGPLAEGLFDYRNYLGNQGIYYQFEVKKISDWRVISSPARAPLADRFCAWARKTLALGLPVEDESLRLEWALTLGWKAALTDPVAEPFIKAATYHIFAVDGLRVAIISGILIGLFRAARIPRVLCGVLAAPIILFYAAMTGWPASAIRAIVMLLVVFGGWALNRPSDLINSLFAAALIILAWQPSQLFQAGFQLSFVVVLCIILIMPLFNRIGEYLLRPDPLRPESLRPRWQKILHWPARAMADLFLASVAAWLGSIPLVALYFHILTPSSGPANILAVPLCALVLICNMSSLLLAGWLSWFAILFNHAGWFFMECIRVTSNWFAHSPGAYFYVPMPGLFTIALYYLILLGALTGWFFKERCAWKMGGATFLILIWCGLWLNDFPTTRLTVLPLTGGHAVYARPGGAWNDWLMDCGNESAVDSTVRPFLQAQGVNHLSNLLLTHGEINYTGGAELITELFAPRNIFTSGIHFRSPEYRKFEAETHSARAAPLEAGAQIGHWTILYPPRETSLAKADDNVLVLLDDICGTRVLLLSDLSHAGQNALLALRRDDLRADIVIAGLPGDSEPFGDALLDAIQPKVIIVADSQQPANKRAGEKLIQRLQRRHTPIIYTSSSDAATLTIRPDSWLVTAMDGIKISSSDFQAGR